VIEWFERQTHKTPTAPAIVHGGATTTYADLRDRVRRIDAALRSRGVAPGDLVGVCMRRSVDLVAALLATMRVGAAYVPIDPHHPSDRISLILEDASPRVLLVDGETAKGLNVRWRDRVLPIAAALAFAPDDPPPVPRATSTNVAYVIFTSGSTGRPKGVRVLHHGLSTFLDAMTQEPGLARDDRLVAVTTVSFDIAGLELYLPLVNGATVVLADAETAMNAEELARLIDSAKATVFQATPATFRMLLQAGWKGRAGLKVLCGGEALPAELAEALLPRVASLWNVYGPTETTIWSTLHRVRPGDRPIPIGRSIRGTQTFVLGSRGKPVPIGCIGELNIGGDGVAEGYHGRDDLTRERFVPNPFSSVPNARMYRTGDLVRVLPDGLLAYVGRADFQVKVRGFRIELGEIESVLTARPEVREAVVVARPDASGEFGLVGYFVPSRAGVDVGELREHLRAKLPTYMVPPQLVGLDALPLTPNGKIDRKALPAPTGGAAAETSGDYEPPKSDVEVRLAAMWEDLLGLKRVGVAQSFFDVGGHSLLAVRLTSRIREELGVPIELVQIFRTPTIRGLADAIGGRALVGGSSVVPLRRGATGAPLVCLCGIALYQRLALAIGGDRPVLGVYIPEEGEMLDRIARGDGGGPSAQVLAASYFRAIQSERGMAPLRLLGFCFGGILAFEVAKLARTAGVEVELLALVDSPLWSRMRRARTKQAAIHARRLLREGPGYLVERFAERRAAGEAQSADAVPDEVARLNALATRSRSYVPTGTYGGRAVVVRTDDESIYGTWRRTRLLGWEGILTGPVETLGLSSHHQELLTGETAAEIGRWLSERP
jgi:amino acid adenylation domain-containing protein